MGRLRAHETVATARGDRIGAHRQAADGAHLGRDVLEQLVDERADEEMALGGEHRLLAVDVEVRRLARGEDDLALFVGERLEDLEQAIARVHELFRDERLAPRRELRDGAHRRHRLHGGGRGAFGRHRRWRRGQPARAAPPSCACGLVRRRPRLRRWRCAALRCRRSPRPSPEGAPCPWRTRDAQLAADDDVAAAHLAADARRRRRWSPTPRRAPAPSTVPCTSRSSLPLSGPAMRVSGPTTVFMIRTTLSQRSLTCHQPDSTVIEPSWRIRTRAATFRRRRAGGPLRRRLQAEERAARSGVEHEKVGVLAGGTRPRLRAHPPAARGDGGARLEPRRGAGQPDRARRGRRAAPSRSSRAVRSSTRARPGRRRCRRCATTTSTPTSCSRSPPSSASRFLACGFRPFGMLEDVPWMPKGRYRVMRAYLPTRGALAHEMMKRTTTVQANFDYEYEARRDGEAARRDGHLVAGDVAVRRLAAGRRQATGYQSYRARAWLDTDPDRCGLLPFAFDPRARFADYAEWALDVPMFFVYRGGEYRPANGMTFRRFLREGCHGERATMSDWDCTCRRCFPRCASRRSSRCARPTRRRARWCARCRRCGAASSTTRTRARRPGRSSPIGRSTSGCGCMRETPKKGLRGQAHGRPMRELCRELVAIARRRAEARSAPPTSCRCWRRSSASSPAGARSPTTSRRVAARRRRHGAHDRATCGCADGTLAARPQPLRPPGRGEGGRVSACRSCRSSSRAGRRSCSSASALVGVGGFGGFSRSRSSSAVASRPTRPRERFKIARSFSSDTPTR